MKKQTKRILFLAALIIQIIVFSSCADFLEYRPDNGKGPVVIMLAGNDGISAHYIEFASRLKKLGYYVLLVDSRDFKWAKPGDYDSKFIEIINKAKESPYALGGKVAIIGFSRGGTVAFAYAVQMSDLISTVIAYYPATMYQSGIAPIVYWNDIDISNLADQIKVPVLAFQGDMDGWYNCCTLERISKIRDAAKAKGKEFNLVVYRGAGHMFNFKTGWSGFSYDSSYDEDSWQKTLEMLKRFH